MRLGVSTACFYPLDTKSAFKALVQAGEKNVEIFFNTDSELEIDYINFIKQIAVENGVTICATHPYLAAIDWFYLYSGYQRRLADGMDKYRTFFERTAMIGANVASFHGMPKECRLTFEQGCEIYSTLYDIASEFRVTLCHENVIRNCLHSAQDIAKLRQLTNERVAFNIDAKQARRCRQPVEQLIEAAGDKLCHFHLSAATEDCDCTLPTNEQVESLFSILNKSGYKNNVVIELYREGFHDVKELVTASQNLQKLC